jgi:hypothetical protein
MSEERKVPENTEELLQKMRKEELPIVHTMFATIHHRSEERPDGYTSDELDQIANELHEQDVERWRGELRRHLGAE